MWLHFLALDAAAAGPTCDDVQGMLRVHVPPETVAETIRSAQGQEELLRTCAEARAVLEGTAVPAPVAAPAPRPAPAAPAASDEPGCAHTGAPVPVGALGIALLALRLRARPDQRGSYRTGGNEDT